MSGLIDHVRLRSVSYVALFLALTGTAYATVSVQGRDVVDQTLTGADVRSGSLGANALEAGAMSAARRGRRGPRGPRGFMGFTGAPGVPGTVGPAATLGLQVVPATAVNPADVDDTTPDSKTVEASCPVGKSVIGGGALITALDASGQPYSSPLVHLREMYRQVPTDGRGPYWRAIAVEELGGFDDQWSVTSYAYCATVTG